MKDVVGFKNRVDELFSITTFPVIFPIRKGKANS